MALALDVYNPQMMERAKNVRSYSIMFRLQAFGGKVLQYAGWAEMIEDTCHICILHEYFSDDGTLDPDVRTRLEMLEFKNLYCIHRVDAGDIVLVQGRTPAKF